MKIVSEIIQQKNTFICGSESFKVFIGKYEGRVEDVSTLQNNNMVFICVLVGVFEVQNRLLHACDGLSLQNVSEIAFEALSNDAMLLILEIFY